MRRIRFLIGIIGLCGIVATALGQPNSSAGVLAKKVEHYQTKGYSVIKAGDFPPAGINNSANYVVVSHPYHNVLRVPALKTVTLEPGTRLFIEPGIKMQVDGHLNAAYAGFSGVVASDLYLGQMIANKNWRGIGVAETGSLNFKGVTIQDADSAIVSVATMESLKIEQLKVIGPSECPVKINGSCQYVTDPSNIMLPPIMVIDNPKPANDQAPAAPKIKLAQSNGQHQTKNTLCEISLWSFVGLGVAALGTGIAAFYFEQQMQQFRSAENSAVSAVATGAAHTKYLDAEKGRDVSRTIAIGAGAASVAFGIVFVINLK